MQPGGLVGATRPAVERPATDDKRYKILEGTMKRHQYRPDALLEVLHTAQELFGCLQDDLLRDVAHALKVPPSRVYGVATFYNFFSLKPRGAHTCVVCMGTACYVKGAAGLLAAIERAQGIKSGETTADGAVSLLTARCLGACGLAPAAVFDDVVEGRVTIEVARRHLDRWQPHDA
jgi:bidirectional [NiFe] hydrogenase diaphorase subunit